MLHALILAGGSGERFWPVSRQRRPKPFLPLLGGQTLFDATLARARRFAPRDRIWVICGREHANLVRATRRLAPRRLLLEPRTRNTAMAVAWASLCISAQDCEAVIAVLPADHHIPDSGAFATAIRRASDAAGRAGALVTLAVKATRADTNYGYIQLGRPVGRSFPRLRWVKRFVEKPDHARARRFLRAGTYRWNAGVFVWSAASFLEEVEDCAPELHTALAPLRRPGGPRRIAAVEAAYRRAPSLPVDVAVIERSRRVWTLPTDFAWNDLGTWAALAREAGVGRSAARGPGARQGNRVLAGDALLEDSRGNLVWGDSKLVSLLGVENLAVVDTGDVILVTKLDRSSDVRRLVSALKARGRRELV